MKRMLVTALLVIVALAVARSQTSMPERIEGLTLERAIELAEQHSPDLAETRWLADAAKSRAASSGRLPNPEAVARIESAPIKGRTSDSAEYVGGVSQTVPLGGRLSAARDVARRESDAASARAELRTREVRGRAHAAFATALYFEAASNAVSNNFAAAQSTTRITKARVEAGDVLREDLARAEMDEFQARLEMNAADAARGLATSELSAALGRRFQIMSLKGALGDALALPAIGSMTARLTNNPAVSVAESELAAQQARVQLAKGERIPDINFDLFYRRLQETRQDAFDAGVRFQIPLFSRPGARVRAAVAEASSAEARVASVRNATTQRFHEARAKLLAALDSAQMLEKEILPRADLVLRAAEARYEAGDEGLSDVLQKRRDRNATQSIYLQALRDIHDNWRALLAL